MTLKEKIKLGVPQLKELIRSEESIKGKLSLYGALTLKSLITLSFCTAFVIIYSAIFGNENSIVGVAVLVSVLAFRASNFGVSNKSSVKILIAYYLILMVFPELASSTSPKFAFVLNFFAMFCIYLLCCWQTHMFNHAIVALNYLLLYGYEIPPEHFTRRALAIAVGGLLTIAVFLASHKGNQCKDTIGDLVRNFSLKNDDSMWQLQSSFTIPLVLFISETMGIPRSMWAGIAAMSVMTPFAGQMKSRFKCRIAGTVIGIGVFSVLAMVLPSKLFFLIGSIGGFCLGFCSTYLSKVPFNTCGALCVGTGLYGFGPALKLRLIHNLIGAIFAVAVSLLFGYAAEKRVCWKNEGASEDFEVS